MKSFIPHRTLLLLSVVSIFISCKKEEEAVVESTQPPLVLSEVNPIPSNNTAATSQIITPTESQTATPVTAPPPVTAKPGMNPPHGQPGHRCDIPVGQPLNSAPAKTQPKTSGTAITQQITPEMIQAASSSQNQSTPAILDPNAAATTTAPGMNPPHGQPGHQCGVAVGAPLPTK